MTRLKLAVITGGVVALLTMGGHHCVQQGRMQEAVRLRSENDRLRLEASRRHQVRVAAGEAGRAKEDPALRMRMEPVEAPAIDAPIDSSVAGTRVPGAEYRYEGQATPIAAMQTVAWACNQGDVALMERLIRFDDDARRKAEAFFLSLPPPARAQWASPEAMAAALLVSAGINSPYPVARIIAEARVEELGVGRKVVHLPGTGRGRVEFQATADGWKYAISSVMVDDHIRRATAQANGGR